MVTVPPKWGTQPLSKTQKTPPLEGSMTIYPSWSGRYSLGPKALKAQEFTVSLHKSLILAPSGKTWHHFLRQFPVAPLSVASPTGRPQPSAPGPSFDPVNMVETAWKARKLGDGGRWCEVAWYQRQKMWFDLLHFALIGNMAWFFQRGTIILPLTCESHPRIDPVRPHRLIQWNMAMDNAPLCLDILHLDWFNTRGKARVCKFIYIYHPPIYPPISISLSLSLSLYIYNEYINI